MPIHFDLIIAADHPKGTAEFRLLNQAGVQLAFRPVDFKTIPASKLRGLFDLRDFLRHYVEAGREAAEVVGVGVCIAEEVLGKEIFEHLWASESQRTLRVLLPGATEEENHLAAALARVPWEIARPAAGKETLGERNLLVRVVHDMGAASSKPVDLAAGEPLRVLFVIAEARGSRPLGARQERRGLLRLFEREIYPNRRVVAHFLTHGVTRERLVSQIKENGGYHVVHWSGHGHLNLLELASSDGSRGGDRISGGQLLDLFTEAGGFLPRLVFLSACHSGDILRVKDWNDFLALAQGKEPGTKQAEPAKTLDLKVQPGFTGTAHALLQGGVSSVVAMRYAVGDDYARELSVEFYRALLAHAQPKTAAAALTQARQAMLDVKRHDPARFAVCDHATPVLYGAEQPGLTLANGRSPELNPPNPRLHQIAELTTTGHEHFVGRSWELAGLGAEFIGSADGADAKPVAVITGLGGMGKTALLAEALALWERRFQWVLLYQAKPNPLGFDAFLRDLHIKLVGRLKLYHDHVRENPADAVYREATAEFTGPGRIEELTSNLVRALRDEPILLVLDNFETNLKPQAHAGPGEGACQDPAWDRCLARLGQELVGSPSRVLITSRRPLAALTGAAACHVPLGPLPAPEAALYLRAHPALAQMVFGPDPGEKALALRLFNASRFHPLLMDRLARLAADPALRPQLTQALDALETTKDFAQLPALFTGGAGRTAEDRAKELTYLNDALAASLDQLIRDCNPDARRLLWIIALANDPEALGLLQGVWSGESQHTQFLRQAGRDLARLHELPPDYQALLNGLPPAVRARIAALPPAPPARPDLAPLLSQLVGVGLVTAERDGPDDANPDLTCHELVRERIRVWMGQAPQYRGDWTENAIRLAYAEWLESVFHALQHKDMANALRAGSRALVYCVQAGAWERLSGFASSLVTSTQDPRLLEGLIPHLRAAAESAPEGRARWSCLGYLADALRSGGRPDVSQPFYEKAAALARAAAEAGGEGARQAWADLAAITGNWASSFTITGKLDDARQRRIESADASTRAGRPAVHIVSSELEALRIDVMEGRVDTALPEIEERLARVTAWWHRYRSGQPVPEAPDAEVLARTVIGALDVGCDADWARKDWESALRRVDVILDVKRALQRPAADLADTRFNRANVLVELPGRFSEARAELEDCLRLFQNDPHKCAKVLSTLSDLFDRQGDIAQAVIQERRALAVRQHLPDPADRAISHNNLGSCLDRHGTPSAAAEASRHRLAALIYRLVAGLGQHLKTSLWNYAIDFRRARAAGTEPSNPRVADLLADPAFHSLDQWLRQRQVDPDALQAAVDQFIEQARQAELGSK